MTANRRMALWVSLAGPAAALLCYLAGFGYCQSTEAKRAVGGAFAGSTLDCTLPPVLQVLQVLGAVLNLTGLYSGVYWWVARRRNGALLTSRTARVASALGLGLAVILTAPSLVILWNWVSGGT